eukprot:Plantae.Rhodophyta-Rhodochaete_pulchella.ctg3417.p3 GENE.Plantae.Rhodophyta-Rhodochaete_pulchella.ctg3417~~Plantae.Rhodophyta-Rhodochaete_pulchella.ctg3417.p3  ORF type:complete len:166 (+),score=28.06 Plantae.Rhodophyta-Rhodochaete_pulchella.ctg3417:159-656(+)
MEGAREFLCLMVTYFDTAVRMKGEVQHGFGRGSKLLGCPTANIPTEPYEDILGDMTLGVYFGWATIHNFNETQPNEIHPMVMSIGWNPFFKNTKKTIEANLLREFENDFYGAELRLVLCGFIRTEADFPSLEALKEEIQHDQRTARRELQSEKSVLMKHDDFLVA